MIVLKDFSKKYLSQKKTSVTGFSMECKKGEITGLLGLNGAGKTTILKAVCARHFATEGEVLVENIDAAESPDRVRNLTGFVQEEPNFPGEYTVQEFLHMVSSLHGMPVNNHTSSDSSRVHPGLASQLSLEEILHKKIKTLSKGQKQRVNFAQALVYNPSVLVLDEPASGLDPAQIVKMRELVKSLKRERTILLSTHLMQEVEALCDKFFIIHYGTLVASGSKEEILADFNADSFEEAFFRITNAKAGAE